ncbi:hypothetical protein QUW14_08780 [Bacteroides gallinaceum]|uniref:hypothetical protein n=1 Tax=Bacteroides gallinaceum TaxID=1462571 RepID=UPI0025A3ED8B|nr:hypothetical protein [Bacteroides gallinaceum]MDM8154403.1 hypothetical protein [Bacteroides gallinaceum]
MKRNILKVMVVIVCAIGIGYNTFHAQECSNKYVFTELDSVEAIAACEVSSDPSKNTGVCQKDINNSREYCVTGIGMSGCCGTI